MCTDLFCECDSNTRIRGKNRKPSITKKAFGFYSVLGSPALLTRPYVDEAEAQAAKAAFRDADGVHA
jgi:hypothetical protein